MMSEIGLSMNLFIFVYFDWLTAPSAYVLHNFSFQTEFIKCRECESPLVYRRSNTAGKGKLVRGK